MDILTIGAGIAGLTAARRLEAAGHRVTVLDKGRAPGGRVSTRRIVNEDADRAELASLAFDHGAQYFTVRDPRFEAEVQAWHQARVAQVWHGRLAAFDSEGREAVDDECTRWVGVPGMSAIARHLARGLDVRCGVRVTTLTRLSAPGAPPRWQATADHDMTVGPFDAVVLALPAPQAVPFLAESPALAATVAAVRMHPCWAVLVAFDGRVPTRFDAAFVGASPLAWVARDRSKPQRGFAETWVLHASAAWSAAHVDDGADVVGPFLLNAFADLVPRGLPHPAWLAAHRWRYACAEPALGSGVLVDDSIRLIVAGDWLRGNRVEGAFLSGLAAADAVARLSF